MNDGAQVAWPSRERHALISLLDRVEVPSGAIAIQFHCQVSMAIKAAGKMRAH